MADTVAFRAFDPKPPGEDPLENERRFRAETERAFVAAETRLIALDRRITSLEQRVTDVEQSLITRTTAIWSTGTLTPTPATGTWTEVPITPPLIEDVDGVFQLSVIATVTGTSGNASVQFRWVWDTGTIEGRVIPLANRETQLAVSILFFDPGANLRLEVQGASATVDGGLVTEHRIGFP